MNHNAIEEKPAEAGAGRLHLAQQAAAAKDALGMIQHLHASGYLAGLKRQLAFKWNRTPSADIDDCIAEAVNAAYVTVSTGKHVASLGAWLYKTAFNLLADKWKAEYEYREDIEQHEELASSPELDEEERQRADEHAEHLRLEAIQIARRLLPAVGHGQVRDVVDLLIQAVEAGEPDLPPTVVAETLGITPGAARSLMSRGLDRLKRAARQAGIEFPDSIYDGAIPDPTDKNDNEEESA